MYFQVNRYYIFMHPLNNLLRAQGYEFTSSVNKTFFYFNFL
jgi:hypothetical protein